MIQPPTLVRMLRFVKYIEVASGEYTIRNYIVFQVGGVPASSTVGCLPNTLAQYRLQTSSRYRGVAMQRCYKKYFQ